MRPELEDRAALLARFEAVRARSLALTAGLSAEDMQVQSMPDVSPTKWHLAHTSWFFETFLCRIHDPGYADFDDRFNYLYNSYYEGVGERWARPERGLLTRPLLAEVLDYRAHVEAAVRALAERAPAEAWRTIAPVLELGLHHEQQHQELLLTDIKHVLSLAPAPHAPFAPELADAGPAPGPAAWLGFEGGLGEFGAGPEAGFTFDNEHPRHRRWQEDFELAARPVSNAEWLAFMEDGGYETAGLWLSDGWAFLNESGVRAPMHWRRDEDGRWLEYTLHGLAPVRPDRPVCHVSGYEAAAFAEWAGARLPDEAELERLALAHPEARGPLIDGGGEAHPAALRGDGDPEQVIGGVWEWTASAYAAYPGYRPPSGPVGEYNGKFMANQLVLRGASALTPAGHERATYRNFFPPDARWQMTGVRLARRLG